MGALPSAEALGHEMHALMGRLFPLDRSLTGEGVRQTIRVLQERVPFEVHEVPSGTPVLDWTVPREWNVREAWIASRDGRVVDFARSNLHLLGYSVPVRAVLPRAALLQRLTTLPDRPDLVPYQTSYWSEDWGFCLSQRQLEAMTDDQYEVCIDATLEDGHLTYAELLLPGELPDEVLVSSYLCHPALANDNLSGVVVVARLAELFATLPRRYSYRFLLSPGTIGPITWLARNEDRLGRIRHGLVVSCVGDPGPVTYKRSRRGDAPVDRAARRALTDAGIDHRVVDFEPWGGDERQFCSPGFDLPVGAFSRTPAGQFPEGHTSADDLDFVRPWALGDSLVRLLEILDILETDRIYLNRSPKGEPQLGRRGLYRARGGAGTGFDQAALLWVLNLADGHNGLLAMSERSGLPFDALRQAADVLSEHGLLALVG